MYIKFDIPRWHLVSILTGDLNEWSDRYDISFRFKMVNHTCRVTFDNDRYYSFFATTWNPSDPELRNYQLIEPMNPGS